MPSNRRSMRNILLNRRYQLRYTAMMVAISALLTTGLGFVWYGQVRETSKIIEVKALASMTEHEVRQLDQEIRRQDNQRLLALVGFGALLVLVVTGSGIMLTHKVAGPMYKITRYMAAVQEGSLAPIGDIRKGDQLHEFFARFREMHDALRDQAAQDADLLQQAIAAAQRHVSGEADEHAELDRSIQELQTLQKQKVGSLKPRRA